MKYQIHLYNVLALIALHFTLTAQELPIEQLLEQQVPETTQAIVPLAEPIAIVAEEQPDIPKELMPIQDTIPVAGTPEKGTPDKVLSEDNLTLEKNQKEKSMIEIGLSAQQRQDVAAKLNLLLANEFVLYTKTLNYHWQIVGMNFGPLHALFKDEYEKLFNLVDDIAERVRTLGGYSYGTLQEFSTHATLKEKAGEYPDDVSMIRHLLLDHEAIIRQIREYADFTAKIGDTGTNNFLSERLEIHEKIAWMLRAHLAA